MQYDAKTPAAYLDMLADDWRRDTLEALRAIISNQAPTLIEGINYKMLSYSDERGVAFHLNVQKGYVSFYTGDTSKIDPDGHLLTGIECGKGCIRFKKSTVVAETRIDEFIARAVELWQQGADIGC